jgi:hypothetical protein
MSLLDIESVCKYTDTLMIDNGTMREFLEKYCLNSIVDKNNIIWESRRTYYLEPSNNPYDHLTRMVDVNTWPIVLEDNIISFHPNVHQLGKVMWLASLDMSMKVPEWLQHMAKKSDFSVKILYGLK